MRMWGINPKILCRQHLLGLHKELHMCVGWLNSKRPEFLQHWTKRKFADTRRIKADHEAVVLEMLARGYNHKSPLPEFKDPEWGELDLEFNKVDLFNRCEQCRIRSVV